MNILLVEDESRVASFIQRGLKAEGWSTTHVPDGEQALEILVDGSFDLVILDLVLPCISGIKVCSIMRSRKNYTPVLMLTALDSGEELVKGLSAGADDYLTKPFSFDELIARLSSLHRREQRYSQESSDPIVKFGSLSFDSQSLIVTISDNEIELTQKEREILCLLISTPNKVFSRERILATVWSASEDPLTNIVDVYIARLRKKLVGSGATIQTVRGIGYRATTKITS